VKRVALGLLVLIFGFLAFVLTSESGLRMTLAALQRYGPPGLVIEDVHGRLIGPLSFARLQYRKATMQVDIEQFHGDWRPRRLWSGVARITRLNVAAVTVHMQGSEDQTPAPVTLPPVTLPFAITIDQLALGRLTVVQDGSAPTHLEKISLAARARESRIDIKQFVIDDPVVQLDLHGRLVPRGAYKLDIEAAWSLNLADQPRFEGRGRVNGDLQSLHVAQDLVQPFDVHLQARIDKPLDDWSWQGRASFDRLAIQQWDKSLPSLSGSGELEGHGNARTVSVDGTVHTAIPGLAPVDVDLGVDYKFADNRLDVRHAHLAIPGSPARLNMRGAVAFHTPQPDFDLAAEWRQLGWPLAAPQSIASPSGSLTFKGGIDAYRARLDAEIRAPGLPPSKWRATATGGTRDLELSRLRIEALGGNVNGHGRVAWSPRLQGALVFTGSELDPGQMDARWPGRLALDGEVNFARDGERLRIELPRLHVDGKIRDYPVTANSKLTLDGAEMTIGEFDLKAGNSAVTVSGAVSDQWRIDWQLHAPRLDEWIPDAGGELQAKGRLSGPRSGPRVTFSGQGHEIKLSGTSVRSASIDGDVDFSDRQESSLRLTMDGTAFSGAEIERIALSANGTSTDHQITLELTAPHSRLDWQIRGALQKNEWQGSLERALVEDDAMGAWQLSSPISLTAARGRVVVPKGCWQRNTARLCLEGRWQRAHGGSTRLELDQFPLSSLVTRLAPDVSMSGDSSGELVFVFGPDKRVGEAHMQLAMTQGSLAPFAAVDPSKVIRFRKIGMEARLEGPDLHGEALFDLGREGRVEATLTSLRAALPGMFGGTLEDAPLHGNAHVDIKNLGPFASWLADVEDPKGDLTGDLRLGGSIRRPAFSGKLNLSSASARVPDLGIQLRDIEAQASTDNLNELHIHATAKSGAGKLELSGRLSGAAEGYAVELEAKGENFTLANTAEYQAIVTPELNLTMRGRSIDVVGRLSLPRARFAPRSLSSSVSPSSDTVFVDDINQSAPAPRWKFSSVVGLHLGDHVIFDSFGLNARISGDIAVTDEPDRFTAGLGTLNILDGQYKAYGTTLNIEQGSLVYVGGPINDPGLNVRAVRKSGEITSGINVRGTLKKPQISIYSDPPMTDSDALSYLVLGRPLTQASSQEGQALVSAASSLGVAGSELLAKQLAQTFGIQDVEIKTEGTTAQDTALVIGKYLSPRLYLSYGVGLFEAVNSLRLRYQLSRKWVLETESGIEQGADLLYTLERE